MGRRGPPGRAVGSVRGPQVPEPAVGSTNGSVRRPQVSELKAKPQSPKGLCAAAAYNARWG
jgi:hypothetical protein